MNLDEAKESIRTAVSENQLSLLILLGNRHSIICLWMYVGPVSLLISNNHLRHQQLAQTEVCDRREMSFLIHRNLILIHFLNFYSRKSKNGSLEQERQVSFMFQWDHPLEQVTCLSPPIDCLWRLWEDCHNECCGNRTLNRTWLTYLPT